jgi:O-antigen ligase
MNLRHYSFYSALQEYSNELFRKNIFSGRDFFWKITIASLRGNWIFGLGTGYLFSMIYDFSGSVHSQYFQILLQNGLAGLSILFVLLFIIWVTMTNKRDKPNLFCIASFVGIILYNAFEVSFLQNKLALGGMQWLILAIGVGRSLRSMVRKNTNNYLKADSTLGLNAGER